MKVMLVERVRFASRRHGSAIISGVAQAWHESGADRPAVEAGALPGGQPDGFIGSLPPNSAPVVSFIPICDIAESATGTLWKPRSARAAA